MRRPEAMTPPKSKEFCVTLQAAGNTLHWVVARIPVDLKRAWPGWESRRVRGEINGFAFRTSLLPGPKGVGFTLLVNKKMQAGAKAGPGASARIRLEPELGAVEIPVPAELMAELRSSRELLLWFQRLSPSMQKGIALIVDRVKTAEARRGKAATMAESLMLAMEGEQSLPPILRVAFQHQPLAENGWKTMTAIQRRNHLFGIFYAQTVDGRNRRAARAIDDCIRIAQRKAK
jgi:uncharacterized protein YdeI (YjbR/CyaY-like superfamily)